MFVQTVLQRLFADDTGRQLFNTQCFKHLMLRRTASLYCSFEYPYHMFQTFSRYFFMQLI